MGELLGDRFELLEPIGSGATGDIWAAYDHRTTSYVAAKVIRQSDAGSLLRFVREQTVRLNDPRVIAPTAWAADDDRVVIAMPLAAGGSVAALVADYGALPTRWVLSLGLDLARGLESVHAAGLVHRDLKPENLLLAATGAARPRLFVADFGSAVALDGPRLTATGIVTGTPGYVAPEVMAGAGPAPAQDLYALGAVLRCMATGRPPTEDGAEPPVPGELGELIAALTGPLPDRPARAADVRDRLVALGADATWQPGADDVEVLRHVDVGTLRPGTGPVVVEASPDRQVTVPLQPASPARTAADPTAVLPGLAGPATGTTTRHQPQPLPMRGAGQHAGDGPQPQRRQRPTGAVWALAVVGVALVIVAVVLLLS